jgi:hypothetical protein
MPVGGTQAQHFHNRMSHSKQRQRQMKALLRKTDALGEGSMRDRIALLMAGGETDTAGRMINFVAAEVVAAARRLCPSDRDLDLLIFEAINDHDVTATFRPFEDGSGVVAISDGLSSLIHYLIRLWAWSLSPGQRSHISLWAMFRQSRRIDSGAQDDLVAIGATLLRYHFIHHRTWGQAAKLEIFLEEKSEELIALINVRALHFILAHEVAHFMLGHQPRSLVAAGALGPEVDASQANEKAADALAFEIMEVLAREGGWPTPQVDRALDSLTMIAIIIAMLALEAVEDALFLRTSHAHPRPGERVRYLSQGVTEAGASIAALGLGGLMETVRLASDLSARIPNEWWGLTYSNKRVSKATHKPEYLSAIANFDKFHSGTIADYKRHASRLIEDGLTELGLASANLDQGLFLESLESLGLSSEQALAQWNPDRPITFVSLRETIQSCRAFQEFGNSTSRLIASVVATRLFERHTAC